jgi:hypothetical protein
METYFYICTYFPIYQVGVRNTHVYDDLSVMWRHINTIRTSLGSGKDTQS